MRSAFHLQTTWQDIRYSLRNLRKSPAFAATAILTLILGIGSNTAIFTTIRAVLLKPLEYPDSDRLIYLSIDNPRDNRLDAPFTVLRYEQMKASARSLSAVGAFLRSPENIVLSGTGDPEVLKGARVSANFLDILGIRPIIGRGFVAEDDTAGGPRVAMISAALWHRRFAGDPNVASKTMTLDSTPHTIVGVLPQRFAFPFPDLDVWTTRPSETSALPPQFWRFVATLIGFARLNLGVTLEQARTEIATLNQQYISANPQRLDARPGVTARVGLLKDRIVSNVRLMLLLLLGATGFVLLIACANLASLLLSSASARSREFAVRAALGANRPRLIRQLLAECSLLAIVGGVLGVLVARVTVTLLLRNALPLPRVEEIRVDGPVLAFTAGISIAAGILFGLFPSLEVSRPNLADFLRDSGTLTTRSSVWRKRHLGFSSRELFIVGQVALSIVLVIGAALLIQSFVRLRNVDPGFQSAELLTIKIPLPLARYDTPEKRLAFFTELERRIAVLPGVQQAAIMGSVPTSAAIFTNVTVAGQPAPPDSEQVNALLQSVTPDYFSTMRIPLRRGRYFRARDNVRGAPLVAIINESFARVFWPAYPRGLDPVGQHMGEGADKLASAEIVGIVGDVREGGLSSAPSPEFYVPLAVHAPQNAYLALRTTSNGLQMANMVRNEVIAVDRQQAVSEIKTMDEVFDTALSQRRLTMFLLATFSSIALLLAAVGLYGVMAHSVQQRIQELGVRRALGAHQGDILRLIVGRALCLTLAGAAIGFGAALALTRVMQALLFQVSATDPAIFAAASAIFVVVALVSSFIPARRALRVDPMSALRAN
jgi:putative ABC transport system permease protein